MRSRRLAGTVLAALLLVACSDGAGDPQAPPSAGAAEDADAQDGGAAEDDAAAADEQDAGPAPFVGPLPVRGREQQAGDARIDVVAAEVTEQGLLVDLEAFNGGSTPVTLLDDPTLVYATTSLGTRLELDPPDDLPVELAAGGTAQLRLAFPGRLDPGDRRVAVWLNHDDDGAVYGADGGGLSAVFEFPLEAAGDADPGADAGDDADEGEVGGAATSTTPQDAEVDVAGVDLRITLVEVEADSTYVTLVATNRRGEDAALLGDAEDTWLLDDRNRRLPVVLPDDDPAAVVSPGEELTLRLGFRGTPASASDSVSLALNRADSYAALTEPGDRLVSALVENLPTTGDGT